MLQRQALTHLHMLFVHELAKSSLYLLVKEVLEECTKVKRCIEAL